MLVEVNEGEEGKALRKGYRTIVFHPEKCDGCNQCIEACAKFHTEKKDPSHSRIKITKNVEGSGFIAALCHQCSDPRCAMNCPATALVKDSDTGVVALNEQKCVGCHLCTLACPYAGVTYDAIDDKIIKCDFCGGEPECVKVCPRYALELKRGADIYNSWGDLEDLFVPGLSCCQGCNSELLIRHTLRRIGPNTVLATPPGCVGGSGAVGYNGLTGTRIPVFFPLLTNTSSMLAGIRRYYNRIGRDVTALAFAGDGGAADVGFQSLSGAAERGEQMIFICIDNEGYMNTGTQRSGTTPYGAWTSTTPVGSVLRGKTRDAKPLALIMVMHNCEYVATASMAFMEDYYAKLDKAIKASKKGTAFIQVFSPCPTGWRHPTGQVIEVSRKAVETNMVPLWEYTNEEGRIRFTRSVENPLPLESYLSLVGKYRHLDKDQKEHLQRKLNGMIEILKFFSIERDGIPKKEAGAR